MAYDERISFDQWIFYVFDHPFTKPEWYWPDFDYWNGSPADVVAHITRTFEECDTVLRSFSDAQVAQGLDFLVNPIFSDYPFSLLETDVPLPDRLHCIEAMLSLFERCFAPRCSPHLSHLIREPSPPGLSALNGACYMWWNVLPLHGVAHHRPDDPDGPQLDRAILTVLRHILKIDSVACQESTLFGLNDCSIYYPEADEIIDEFVARHPDLWERFNPALRENSFGRN